MRLRFFNKRNISIILNVFWMDKHKNLTKININNNLLYATVFLWYVDAPMNLLMGMRGFTNPITTD